MRNLLFVLLLLACIGTLCAQDNVTYVQLGVRHENWYSLAEDEFGSNTSFARFNVNPALVTQAAMGLENINTWYGKLFIANDPETRRIRRVYGTIGKTKGIGILVETGGFDGTAELNETAISQGIQSSEIDFSLSYSRIALFTEKYFAGRLGVAYYSRDIPAPLEVFSTDKVLADYTYFDTGSNLKLFGFYMEFDGLRTAMLFPTSAPDKVRFSFDLISIVGFSLFTHGDQMMGDLRAFYDNPNLNIEFLDAVFFGFNNTFRANIYRTFQLGDYARLGISLGLEGGMDGNLINLTNQEYEPNLFSEIGQEVGVALKYGIIPLNFYAGPSLRMALVF